VGVDAGAGVDESVDDVDVDEEGAGESDVFARFVGWDLRFIAFFH